jgi:hypothetical protein
MSRTHDVTISAFDLDQLERELAAVTEERDELKSKYRTHHDEAERITNEICRVSSVCRKLERELAAVTEQRDRLAEAARTLPDYDAGLLNDFGGGDAGWWQDYIRAEIGRANEYYREALAAVKGGSDE